MTTTKVKTRKSDQLSLPGPEELFLYNLAKNIWMEGKALYFPGTRNTGQFTRRLWSIFLIQAKIVKSLNISCQQTQTLHRRPDELHRLKPFPPKRKRTNAHQVLGKLPKKRVLFFVILRCSIVFFPDKMVDRDQAPVVQTLDSAIHRINHYPADKYYGNQLRYPLGNDLSCG